MAGISGILQSGAYRNRPKALDLHDLYNPPDLPGLKSSKIATGALSPALATLSPSMAYERILMDGMPFDSARLPLAYGPKSTETLIEAIFNPVPTHSATTSPFTYYVPEPKKRPSLTRSQSTSANDSLKFQVHEGDSPSEAPSVYSTDTGSEDTHTSDYTTTTKSSEPLSISSRSHSIQHLMDHPVPTDDRSSSWWKKLGSRSRPATPGL
jgi:hypothetical protein